MTCKKTFWGQKHNWRKWEKTDDGKLENWVGGSNLRWSTVGYFVKLERECKDCGYQEIDIIKHKF